MDSRKWINPETRSARDNSDVRQGSRPAWTLRLSIVAKHSSETLLISHRRPSMLALECKLYSSHRDEREKEFSDAGLYLQATLGTREVRSESASSLLCREEAVEETRRKEPRITLEGEKGWMQQHARAGLIDFGSGLSRRDKDRDS
jgi:hypothetical protein